MIPQMRFRDPRQFGMTLIEVTLSIGIFAIVLVAISAFQVNIFQYRNSAQNMIISAQDAESILKTMVKELRSARQGADGSYAIVSAGTSTLTFFSDAGGDGTVDEISYYIASSTLKRSVISPSGSPAIYDPSQQRTSILINTVVSTTSPVFEYYDNTYTGTSSALAQPVSPSAVSLVKISVTIDADPKRSPTPITYTSEVSLRNIKNNL